MKKEKIISYTLNVLVIIFLVLAFVKYYKTRDIGEYSFCIEWNYDIYREDLLWKCFDFETNEKICGWDIVGNRLIVYNYYNKSDYMVYQCTQLAKTINIELELPEIEEI